MRSATFLLPAFLCSLALALFGGLVILIGSLATASSGLLPGEPSRWWVELQTVTTTPTSTSTSTRTPTSTSTSTPTDTATATQTSTATGTATITGTPTETSTATATPIPPPAICVLVFEDQDGDESRDPGEGLLAGALITVTTEIGGVIGTRTTNGTEPYCFTSLPVGVYWVEEENPPGYDESTTPDTVGVNLFSASVVIQVEFGDRLLAAATATGTPTQSPTRTSTATQTYSPTVTGTATATGTPTESPTQTATATQTQTHTPTGTATETATTTFTPTTVATETATATSTSTAVATDTPTATATATPSHTSTGTPTPVPTWTPTTTSTPGPIVVRSHLPLVLRLKVIPPPPTPTPAPTATPTPGVSCSEAIINGGFEEIGTWIFGNTPRPGQYISEEAYLGHRSVLLGIKPPESDAYSWSSVRQRATIPADAVLASLSFWYKPYTEEPPALDLQMEDGEWQIADSEWQGAGSREQGAGSREQVAGSKEQGADELSAISQPDRQEALILDDQFPDPAVLAVLMRLRSNSQTWTRQTHDLRAFAGRTIYVYFNAFNNGEGGLRTWMYLDEVSLKVCTNVSS